MKVTFHGAAGTVTGSQHEVSAAGQRLLLDCGLFQGPRAQAKQINCCFAFPPTDLHAVILSHGHADHCGNLPNLIKQGFRGPIYATPATAAIAALMLRDSAKIQQEDAAYLNKKLAGTGQPRIDPLYTLADAEQTITLFESIEYRQPRDLGGFTVEFRDAGHILGSAAISLTETASQRTLVFTGDIGRPNSPVLQNADPFTKADVLITECTYGGRHHQSLADIPNALTAIIQRAVARGGWVIIPAFALGRAQTLIFMLHELVNKKQIPTGLPIFVDSPLSNRITEVFRQFGRLMDDETRALATPFDFPNLTFVASVDESRALNDRPGPGVIIASSGMCESGRILHHLKHHIADARNTVLLPGYQAEHTLGRKIQDHFHSVPILGDIIPVRAHIEKIDGLSAHADEPELLAYTAPLLPSHPRVYLVHGETEAAQAHRTALIAAGFTDSNIAQPGETTEV